KFPAAEVHAITYYLFAEGRGHLKGEDTGRKYLRQRLEEMHGLMAGAGARKLSEKERKELDAVSRGVADLALLSNPANANDINAKAAAIQDLHARLIEAGRAEDRKAVTDPEVVKELARLRQEIIDLARPTPIALGLRDYDGHALYGQDGKPVTKVTAGDA